MHSSAPIGSLRWGWQVAGGSGALAAMGRLGRDRFDRRAEGDAPTGLSLPAVAGAGALSAGLAFTLGAACFRAAMAASWASISGTSRLSRSYEIPRDSRH